MRDFNGKLAVITGAASGIGLALAEKLADQGCDLALVDVNEDNLLAAADRIGTRGVQVSHHRVDVADRAAMEQLVDDVIEAHGRVDIVVNNAGVSVGATLEEHSLDDFEWLVGINFWGVVYGCKLFLPHLKKSDDAYIVNLSSMFGLIGVPGQSSYCATKFAVRGFSEALAVELAKTSVRVLSVHPGGIATNIAKATRYAEGHDSMRKRAVDIIGRGMPPEDAADRILDGMHAGASRKLITKEAYVTDYVKRVFPSLPTGLLAKAFEWARS